MINDRDDHTNQIFAWIQSSRPPDLLEAFLLLCVFFILILTSLSLCCLYPKHQYRHSITHQCRQWKKECSLNEGNLGIFWKHFQNRETEIDRRDQMRVMITYLYGLDIEERKGGDGYLYWREEKDGLTSLSRVSSVRYSFLLGRRFRQSRR